jgi:MFS family permease
MSYGKWNLILLANVIYDVGVIITLINNPVLILIGRFIQGISAGAFTVLTPKFIDELAPLEYKGSFGTVSQLGCTLGIFLVAALCLPIPSEDDKFQDDFIVNEYWRVVWGLPLLLSALQMTLMITVFKYDTPTALKQRGDTDKLTELLSSIYTRDQVQWRMDEIVITETGHTDEEGRASLKVKKLGMMETFTHPDTKWAAWMGCTISAFQ